MNLIEDIAGELCKLLLPIEEKIFFGNSSSPVAICTLSSMRLLKEIARSSRMTKIAVVGRLLSENKGIDLLVRSILSNNKISTLILCGKDTAGHRPGHSLLCLYQNGIDENNRIIGSESPHPFLTLTRQEVTKFQNQVKIVNKIGENNILNLELAI